MGKLGGIFGFGREAVGEDHAGEAVSLVSEELDETFKILKVAPCRGIDVATAVKVDERDLRVPVSEPMGLHAAGKVG